MVLSLSEELAQRAPGTPGRVLRRPGRQATSSAPKSARRSSTRHYRATLKAASPTKDVSTSAEVDLESKQPESSIPGAVRHASIVAFYVVALLAAYLLILPALHQQRSQEITTRA